MIRDKKDNLGTKVIKELKAWYRVKGSQAETVYYIMDFIDPMLSASSSESSSRSVLNHPRNSSNPFTFSGGVVSFFSLSVLLTLFLIEYRT